MGKKTKIKKQISETFDIPEEVILDVPVIKITGNNELCIENHKGILEYTREVLRMNSISGIVKITGKNIQIKEIDQSDIFVSGEICSLEFIK